MNETTAPTPLEKWLVLNLYGTVLLALAAGVGWLGLTIGSRLHWPAAAAVTVALAPSAAVALLGLRITLRLPTRLRVFRVVMRRIRRRGFDTRYFEALCREPCMRCVTWLALKHTGEVHRYCEIVRRYRGSQAVFLEHSDPVIDDLIAGGELPDTDVRAAVLLSAASGSPIFPAEDR